MKRTSTLVSPLAAVPALPAACAQGSELGAPEGYRPDVAVACGELIPAGP